VAMAAVEQSEFACAWVDAELLDRDVEIHLVNLRHRPVVQALEYVKEVREALLRGLELRDQAVRLLSVFDKHSSEAAEQLHSEVESICEIAEHPSNPIHCEEFAKDFCEEEEEEENGGKRKMMECVDEGKCKKRKANGGGLF